MREILFKAKVKDWEQKPKDEQWVYGYYVRGFNVYEEPVHMIFEPTTMFFSHGETDGWDEIDPSTLCQYTGLTDKNGNKIWENDILIGESRKFVINYYTPFTMYMMKVIGHGGGVNGATIQLRECEVIGNIFDNPELIN